MKPSCVLFLLSLQVFISLEWGVRVEKGGRVGTPQRRAGSFALLRSQMGRSLDQSQHVLRDFKASGGTLYRIDSDDFEGVGSGHNDVHSEQYGQFNSDMSGCNGIESRKCTKPSDCAGCLGLYSCKVSIHKCQPKGLSNSPSGFLKNLEKV